MKIAEYPRHFSVVAVQQTFYQPPEDATLERWRSQAPTGFEFIVKAWQLVTHRATSSTYRRLRRPLDAHERAGLGGFRNTLIVQEGWKRTLDCARLLRATAILFQTPASFDPSTENVTNLRRFFERIDRPREVRLMWEPRGPWPESQLRQLFADLALVHVVDPFVIPPVSRRHHYFRLHGLGSSRHSYTDAELEQLLATVPRDGETHVMFNNLPRVGDAKRFQARVTDHSI